MVFAHCCGLCSLLWVKLFMWTLKNAFNILLCFSVDVSLFWKSPVTEIIIYRQYCITVTDYMPATVRGNLSPTERLSKSGWIVPYTRLLFVISATKNKIYLISSYLFYPTREKSPWHLHFEAESNGRHFTDDNFKCIFLNGNAWIPIKISLKFVPKSPINNISVLVQIMAWCRPGDKPLSELIMVSLPTHIYVTRPQWINIQRTGEYWAITIFRGPFGLFVFRSLYSVWTVTRTYSIFNSL